MGETIFLLEVSVTEAMVAVLAVKSLSSRSSEGIEFTVSRARGAFDDAGGLSGTLAISAIFSVQTLSSRTAKSVEGSVSVTLRAKASTHWRLSTHSRVSSHSVGRVSHSVGWVSRHAYVHARRRIRDSTSVLRWIVVAIRSGSRHSVTSRGRSRRETTHVDGDVRHAAHAHVHRDSTHASHASHAAHGRAAHAHGRGAHTTHASHAKTATNRVVPDLLRRVHSPNASVTRLSAGDDLRRTGLFIPSVSVPRENFVRSVVSDDGV